MKKENKLFLKWISVPLFLKMAFVIIFFGLISSIYTFNFNYFGGYSFLGFDFSGLPAMLFALVLDIIGSIIVLTLIWTGKKWGFWYSIIYYSFFILNAVLALLSLKIRLNSFAKETGAVSETLNNLFSQALITGIFGIGIYLLLLILIIANKKHFLK